VETLVNIVSKLTGDVQERRLKDVFNKNDYTNELIIMNMKLYESLIKKTGSCRLQKRVTCSIDIKRTVGPTELKRDKHAQHDPLVIPEDYGVNDQGHSALGSIAVKLSILVIDSR